MNFCSETFSPSFSHEQLCIFKLWDDVEEKLSVVFSLVDCPVAKRLWCGLPCLHSSQGRLIQEWRVLGRWVREWGLLGGDEVVPCLCLYKSSPKCCGAVRFYVFGSQVSRVDFVIHNFPFLFRFFLFISTNILHFWLFRFTFVFSFIFNFLFFILGCTVCCFFGGFT